MFVNAVEFGFLESQDVHFDDLDTFGLLHNSRYALLAERAWIAYWYRDEITFSHDRQTLGDGYTVVKELLVSFDQPINRPGTYGIHMWVERIGRTSLTYGFRICSEDGALTYAHGHRVLVRLDPATLRPSEWSERGREICEGLMRPESSATA